MYSVDYLQDIGEETTVTTTGIPPDGFLRTLNGLYPAGGLIDYRISVKIQAGAVNGDGNQGAGVTPILLASWVDFMQAEAAWNGWWWMMLLRKTHLEME